METQYISLNMTPTGVNPCFHISQYDVGRMLGFIVHSGGATVDLDTYTCTIEATRSDGTAITSAVATTDNIGTFEVTPTMSNKTDKYRCQLVIVDANSKRIASLPFDMDVCKAAMDENSESIEEDASLYQQYTKAVQGAIAEANADIQAEENARIAAVTNEKNERIAAVTNEKNERIAAVTNEKDERIAAVNAEATARQTADNTLQDNINSEAATRASADSNLQSQINQIVAPSGEAPSAAEVQNARIGADGVTYDTLGTAIRTQVNNLSKANIQVILPVAANVSVLSAKLTITDTTVLYIANSKYEDKETFYFSDIAAQIPEYATWDADSKTFTLNLGNRESRFVYNTSTKKFRVDETLGFMNDEDVVLYWSYYGKPGGILYNESVLREVTEKKLDVILPIAAKVSVLSAKLTITDTTVLYIANSKYEDKETFYFSDIAAQIPEYATWDADSKTFTLNLGNRESRFVYNTSTKKFRVDETLGFMNDEDVVLYWSYYGKPGGILYNESVLREVTEKKLGMLVDNDACVIFTENTKVVSCGRGGFVLSGAVGFYIANRCSSEKTLFYFSDIAAQIPKYATWDADSKTFTLNLGSGERRFGFDTSTNKFIVDIVSAKKPYGLIVLYWSYFARYGGKIADQITTRLYLENKDKYLTNNSLQKDTFNASFHTGAKDFATVCKRYSSLFVSDEKNNVKGVDKCEAFLWFTDPHLFTDYNGQIDKMEEYIGQIQKYYNSTPTTFALCGGDWLGNSDTPDMACYKMGYINGICKSMFDKCYMLVGNHDTNYQGKKDADSSTWTTRLSRLTIRNLWYRDIGRSYYDFNGVNTHFYCFDTGIENQTLEYDNGYGYEQATWFAEKLMNERYDHVAIAAHIYAYQTIPDGTVPNDVQPLTRMLLQISSAYNQRSEINVNGKNYNFIDATGRVEFMLAGHSHEDYTLIDSGVPIIATLDCGNHQSYTADCSLDLVFVDYDNRKIKCIRAGIGEDREINLDN